MNDASINRSWINNIDSNLLELYPIQFANCDRLQKNDAVYIFDEVGSGKTISSGLMALDYLMNNPQKQVYVITTNALAKKGFNSKYGQFLKDWYEKLPFCSLGLSSRIKVINNHYSNIKNIDKCGLLIVDEAQLFLNDGARRNECLRKIRSEKIVFLTATPIKTSKDDLYTYVSIAKEILQNQNLDDGWVKDIGTEGKSINSIICSEFDYEYPVTRYFKDTIMAINVEGYEKKQARRLIPQLWEYDHGDVNTAKNAVMLRRINECLSKCKLSRFVVFTRFVEKEAIAIGEFLSSNGFNPHSVNSPDTERTFKIVTGDNSFELSKYSGRSNLPTILILTYQIAEQGVNLPGYNYVINYHISAFPSALEQRFGRIDRMGKEGSLFQEINMCFLISKDYWDTNTWNFYSAMSIYMRNLISYLPSKNTILSKEIVNKYISKRENVEKYIQRIKDLLSSKQQIELIIEYFTEKNNIGSDSYHDIECKCDKDLYTFIDENAIEIDRNILNEDKETAIAQFKKEINDKLKEYESAFDNGELSDTQMIELIESVGDKVFYRSNGEIHTVDAVEECGEIISNSPKFAAYKEIFSKNIKCSTTDSESGWFRKGEHKNVFAYAIETACDKNGWIQGI